MDYLNFLLRLGGVDHVHAAEACDKHPRQWRRYLTGAAPVPADVLRLVETRLAGLLGTIHPAWDGWRLVARTGELVSPDGEVWTPEVLRELFWYHQRLSAERAELRAALLAAESRAGVSLPRLTTNQGANVA